MGPQRQMKAYSSLPADYSPCPNTSLGEDDDDVVNRIDAIPKLYSSRMYKEYLKSQRHVRMPHYLTRVEDSPKQAR